MALEQARLLIPAGQADRWPWLDASLAHAAAKAGVAVDGGEVVGSHRSYGFGQRSAAELKPFIDYALLRGGETVWARATGENEITVRIGFDWIRPMGVFQPTLESPHPYYVAFRHLCKLLAWDDGWKSWWATSSYTQFNFHQKHADPHEPWEWDDETFIYVVVPLDLSILSVKNPTQLEIERQAAANVRVVLSRLALRVDTPTPPLPQ